MKADVSKMLSISRRTMRLIPPDPLHPRVPRARAARVPGHLVIARSSSGKGSDEALSALREACEIMGLPLREAAGGNPAGGDEEEEETYDDIMEEMEDFWQRDGVSSWAELEEVVGQSDEPASSGPAYEGFTEIGVDDLQGLDMSPTDTIFLNVRDDADTALRLQGGLQYRHIPFTTLTAEVVDSLRGYRTVVVLATTTTRSRQACVRLQRVYGLQDVRHFVGTLEEVQQTLSS